MTDPDQRSSIERLVANARDTRLPYPPQSDMGMIIWLLDALKAAEAEIRAAKAEGWDRGYVAGSQYTRDAIYAGLAEERGYSAIHESTPINPYQKPESNDDNNLRTWRNEGSNP